jgi:hypothetical protein
MQALWIVLAGGLFAGAGLLLPIVDRISKARELTTGAAEAETGPGWVTMIPGGLRAVAVNYLWIRAQSLHDDGRYYDAKQNADLICRLQPRFAGVWDYHAWNMAWNISVAHHTPDERWLWVHNGIELLRDRGIPLNPRSLELYKSLGWIFFSKMGGTTDEMHMVYKARWAAQMQHLLAAPPYGTTREAIEALRPIAEAPLDRDPRRGRKAGTIQADQLAGLLAADPQAAAYVEKLAQHGVSVGPSLLDAYNRLSRDEAVEVVRNPGRPHEPEGDAEQALAALINSEEFAPARKKLLAFVRAQALWHEYKMDPAWMLKLMEHYYAPLDWRLVWTHGIYWMTYGFKVCEGLDPEQVPDPDAVAERRGRKEGEKIILHNARRIILNCLKDLTFYGLMTYRENPDRPEAPVLGFLEDRRYVEAVHQEHLRLIDQYLAEAKSSEHQDEEITFARNIYNSGHINYLASAIGVLVRSYELREAQRYYDFIREKYEYKDRGGYWGNELVTDFINQRLEDEGRPIPAIANSQIASALRSAYVQLAAGNGAGYRQLHQYARHVYDVYQRDAPQRVRLRAFAAFEADVLGNLLVEPRMYGYNLSLLTRSQLYTRAGAVRVVFRGQQFRLADMVYDPVARPLAAQCGVAEIDFDKAFPRPGGLEDFRRWVQQERLRMMREARQAG